MRPPYAGPCCCARISPAVRTTATREGELMSDQTQPEDQQRHRKMEDDVEGHKQRKLEDDVEGHKQRKLEDDVEGHKQRKLEDDVEGHKQRK